MNIVDPLDDLISWDWANFWIKFEMSIKNPLNYRTTGTTITATIRDAKSNRMYAMSNKLANSFKVVRVPLPEAASTDVQARVGFNVNPLST